MHVDPVLIEQALARKRDNAAKYSPPGSVIRIDGAPPLPSSTAIAGPRRGRRPHR